MVDSWWIVKGYNYLKGVLGDSTNPIRLGDDFILDFLKRIPIARDDLERIYPSLLPAEKERIDTLLLQNPYIQRGTFLDPRDKEDRIQKHWNTAGIYTTGKRGGMGFG